MENENPRVIDIKDLKERRIKPLISLRLDKMPEIDIIGELVLDDEENYLLHVSNLFLAIPVQNQGDTNISLGLRPWSMTVYKDQIIIFNKENILTYFEITNQVLINSYINSTSDIKIASPGDIPPPSRRNGVIDLVRN